ncbi:hypothetical protein QJS04_geneDACA009772 [Acorus gramineus]|uniref:Uncharacterized protein n=1 Tax=Acorus gramineus TaxID=55184 RepID=A0AAV9B7J0_ACOGR|nr:hypothetical protein QJS04_geneDACA009772 [Acorus gramineus]
MWVRLRWIHVYRWYHRLMEPTITAFDNISDSEKLMDRTTEKPRNRRSDGRPTTSRESTPPSFYTPSGKCGRDRRGLRGRRSRGSPGKRWTRSWRQRRRGGRGGARRSS